MNIRNEIKAYIVREGMTMNDVIAMLSDEYGWSGSVSNFSDKLRRGSLRYREAEELADTREAADHVISGCYMNTRKEVDRNAKRIRLCAGVQRGSE